MSKRPLQRLDIFLAANERAGENFDEGSPGLPRHRHLSRLKRHSQNRDFLFDRKFHELQVETGTCQEFRTGIQTTASRFLVENSASTHNHVGTVPRQFGNQLNGSWHGHSDFNDRYSATRDRLYGKPGVFSRTKTHGRDDSDLFNPSANFFLLHRNKALSLSAPNSASWPERNLL